MSRAGGFGKKRSTKAISAVLPASSSATTRNGRVVREVPRHPEEREPVLRAPARQRRAGEEPRRRNARRRAWPIFRPGRGRRPTRPGSRSAGKTAGTARAERGAPAAAAPRPRGRGGAARSGRARPPRARSPRPPSAPGGPSAPRRRAALPFPRARPTAPRRGAAGGPCAPRRARPLPARPRPAGRPGRGPEPTRRPPGSSSNRWPSHRCGSRPRGRGRRAVSPRDRRRRGAQGRSSGSSSSFGLRSGNGARGRAPKTRY